MADDEKKLLKKTLKILEEEKKKKRPPTFDTGLLWDAYEQITGTAEEIFSKWREKLLRARTRLDNLNIDSKEEGITKIITEIDNYFVDVELPELFTEINDYAQKEGRIITVLRADKETKSSCVDEIFDKTIEKIREEQYFPLINSIAVLHSKAIAVLKKDVFTWHKKSFKLHIPSIGDVVITGDTDEKR